MKKLAIKITGESGSGLLSTGEILLKAFKCIGYFIHAERDYPSLIKGGSSVFHINVSTERIHCLNKKADIIVALDRMGIVEYADTLKDGGILIHGQERQNSIKDILKGLEERNVKIIYIPARTIAYEKQAGEIMVNMVLLGLLWRILDLNLQILKFEVAKKFETKDKSIDANINCIQAGYDATDISKLTKLAFDIPSDKEDDILIDGNTAIALGAINCGVRAYYAYPMSPSSSILSYLAKKADDTKMIVKQAEDEITAVQMALGSMHMGTRAMTATSGGGFDLMTESISLAGMIETPLVVVIAQRPGPATGLPTWTAQSDLNMAIFSSHGEFPKIVIALSDPVSCYSLIPQAFNLAEEFQVPVLVLSEKTISEALETVPRFKDNTIGINRGLVSTKEDLKNLDSNLRYKFSESGISKRWLPGSSTITYFANGDEHNEDGTITETSKGTRRMAEKRLRKMREISRNIPGPRLYGPDTAEFSFIGFGSTKNVMLDAIVKFKEQNISVNYLHYDFVWPLRTDRVRMLFKTNKNVFLVEGNSLGQLGNLIEYKARVKFHGRLLKYDGRPFYIEDIEAFITRKIEESNTAQNG